MRWSLVAACSRVLTPFVTAEEASEIYIALTSAIGHKDFFKNKGPDPTVRNGKLFLLELC